MNMATLKHSEITSLLIKAFFNVYNSLGSGFLEKVYENSMIIEARNLGLVVKQQAPISVFYANNLVGEYFADLLVNDTVVVELKVARELAVEHEAQLIHYLKATTYEVGLLLNFGSKPEFRRRVLDNNRKKVRFDPCESAEIRG
jgi:GxxExxY protein